MENFQRVGRRRFVALGAALMTNVGWGNSARAQSNAFPVRPIRIIVPSGPGSAIDAVVRIVQPRLARELGQPVVIENKPGADFSIGASYVARSAADGYTLLLGSIPLTTNPVLRKVPYDTLKDFEPVANICNASVVVVVPRALGISKFEEFIETAKRRPGELNFANAAVGSLGHINLALLEQATSIRTTVVSYPGQAASITDLLANRVNFAMLTPIVALPHVQSGALVPLALVSSERNSVLPDVPTMRELGMKGIDVETWVGILAPAGTPAGIVQSLNTAIVRTVQDTSIRLQLEKQGSSPAASHTPEEFARMISSQLDRWPQLFKAANIRVD